MSAPLRWKDDPSFEAETGVNLADEAAVVGGYALNSMRAAVVSGTSAPTGGTGWVAIGGGALVVLAAAWMWWPGSSVAERLAPPMDVTTSAAPARAPQMAAAVAPEPSAAVGTALEVVRVQPASVARPPTQPAPQAAPVVAVVAPVEIAPPPAAEVDAQAQGTADAPEVSAAPTSDLAQQLAVYRQGQSALESGDLGAAGASFQRYLETWPNGQVRDEVLVSVLEIVIQRQQWSQVEILAGQLGAVQALSSRHTEFRRVRAEALSQLNRCPEALKLAESLSRPDAQAVKQRCRRTQP